MFLKIDTRSGTPIYLQIIDQIKLQIASGRLKVGDQCPTVRDLATELRVNPNTIAKSYRELEREGILQGRPRQGSFITGGDSGLSDDRRQERVERLMQGPVVEAFHLKLSRRTVSDIFKSVLDRIYSSKTSDDSKEREGGVK